MNLAKLLLLSAENLDTYIFNLVSGTQVHAS